MVFSTLPLNRDVMYPILENLSLSEQAWELIRLSFRSRIKEAPEWAIAFQFKIAPATISAKQEKLIDIVREEILPKLQEAYPQHTFIVSFTIAECCGSDCFGCTTFRA